MLTHPNPTATRTPSCLATPPPVALDLSHAGHAGRPVGWVRGAAIGFLGFASNVEAAHAAWVAYRALAQRLAKAGGRRPIPVDIGRLTLSRSGDVDLVMASGDPIATLLRPGPGSRSGDSFGFEIRVPAPTYETRMRGMAYLAYRTMRKSGVRWALWGRDRWPRERRADAIPAERSTPPRAPRPASRWAAAVTVIVTASVAGLLLALAVPERLAAPLTVLALAGLLASRLLVPQTEWSVTRRIRLAPPDRETRTERDRPPPPAVASEAADQRRWPLRAPPHSTRRSSVRGRCGDVDTHRPPGS